ncbi:MAG TPA: PKD domain-containing protein [Candidatus Acetothermia bacterium]|nr:PKD domain-containing protein [Candidatus Acetothermia bacterium]
MNRLRLIALTVLLLAVIGVGGCFLFPNHPPVASFTVEYNTNTQDPMVVVLDASTSSDPDGDEIVSYMWIFGDDVTILTPLESTKTVTVPVLTVKYPVQDTYTVKLTVVDSRGGISDQIKADLPVPAPQE